MTRRPDGWIRWTTTGCVALLALIAGTVSYLHMHQLVAEDGQPGWVAALTPLSVDGMIVAASTALLAHSRSGRRGGMLPRALLVTGSVASLAANVAVAEPTATGRVIAAWPSFALIGSYELLMRQVRRTAVSTRPKRPIARNGSVVSDVSSASARSSVTERRGAPGGAVPGTGAGWELQLQAWLWAQANGQVTVRCLPARLSPASTVGTSAGVGWSSRLTWRARTQQTSKPPSNAQRPLGRTTQPVGHMEQAVT